ncbi:multidrug ABC transporter permease [Planomonospora parontospora subsp. parontospora]|uniref:Multidrug ABC transporter permease n=2 Tax=Planomonospora parontospora TaxID=58119 RepID=A0AA37F894_9ACTN|nr:ABC transporter ATP-binding protein [Planomonospora parontospora]GGK99290.1 multidrug ABC transporter permease [Planomonospora parontospora]GII12965.1 multidrug ABC transporter permease [Planomonospora parontospora subsp. parontospora]
MTADGLRRAAALGSLCLRAGPALAASQLAVTVVAGLLPTGTVWVTKLLVDALAAGPAERVPGPVAGLVALGLAAGVLPHVTAYLRAESDRRLDLLLQDRLYTRVNGFQGLSRFEDPAFLDELRMAAQATGGAMGPVTSGLFDLCRNVITLTGLLGALAVMSPLMAALVAVAALPVLAARMSLEKRRARMIAGQSAAARRQIFYSSLITDVEAAKEVRLFGLGDFLRRRVIGELTAMQAAERRLDRREAIVQSSLAALSALVSGVGLAWAVHLALTGRLTLGDVTAFAAAVAGTQAALVATVENAANASHALLLFGHHERVMSLSDDLPSPRGPVALPALRRGIELRDVWFRYDESHPWVLRGVDLTIPRGASVALVGLNGAGKSTLIKLLCRFYDPSRGVILWDGVDIRDVPPTELRARMGVLFQDYMSYDLTAAENIGVGEIEAMSDRTRIENAAELSGAGQVVRALPQGYDTLLSRIFLGPEDGAGVVLSGGQWQRVALARALVREHRDLLILDEPSAGLDAEAEHEVHRRLREHRTGRTSLLVTHRLSAVRDADLIVVLRGGRIVERGTHDGLVAAGGGYARLFETQASGYRVDA